MGLFDGPVMSFAEKFCRYLDERIAARVETSKQCDDGTNRLMHLTIAMALQEVSQALKTVAGIE